MGSKRTMAGVDRKATGIQRGGEQRGSGAFAGSCIRITSADERALLECHRDGPGSGSVRARRNTAQRLAQIARAGRVATPDRLGLGPGLDGEDLELAEAAAGGEACPGRQRMRIAWYIDMEFSVVTVAIWSRTSGAQQDAPQPCVSTAGAAHETHRSLWLLSTPAAVGLPWAE